MSASLPWSFPEEALGWGGAHGAVGFELPVSLEMGGGGGGQAEGLAGASDLGPAGSTWLRMAADAA